MDFEKLFNDLLSNAEVEEMSMEDFKKYVNKEEMSMEDFKKYVNKEKKLYVMRDFPNNDYYTLKLSDESKNLLEWLIKDIELLDAHLIPMDEIDAMEF